MAREEPFSTKFNVWWVLSAALVALVLVGGIALGFFAGRNHEDDQGEPQPESSEAADTDTSQAGGACGVPADDQDYPVEAPESKWEAYKNGITVPTSQTYGPTKRDGNFWKCYAHSPTGALFAAFNLSQAFLNGGVYEAAVDSPEAKEFFDEESSVSSEDKTMVELAGFQIVSYEEDTASVDLLLRGSDANASLVVDLVWDEAEDDWRWDAGTVSPPEAVEDTSAYTSWSPRNG